MRLDFTTVGINCIMLISGVVAEDNCIVLHPDLELREISKNVYVHTSYMTLERYGRFPCNGLVYIKDGKSAIIDTPVSDELSEYLISLVE